jgi:small Trp-rich protein
VKMGLFGAVFVVFLVMKLAQIGAVADWSWWWVTSPLWIGTTLMVALILTSALLTVRSRRMR